MYPYMSFCQLLSCLYYLSYCHVHRNQSFCLHTDSLCKGKDFKSKYWQSESNKGPIFSYSSSTPSTSLEPDASTSADWKFGKVPAIVVTPPLASESTDLASTSITENLPLSLPSTRNALKPNPPGYMEDIGLAYSTYQKVMYSVTITWLLFVVVYRCYQRLLHL